MQKSKFKNYFYLYISIGILIVLLILWGCLSFSYVTATQRQQIKTISGQGVTLQILYPNKLLLGESASEIYFDILVPATYTNNITITLDFPPEIRPVTLTTYTNHLSAQLVFPPAKAFQSQSISVVNAGVGWVEMVKQITGRTNLQADPFTIDIKIAGIWAGAFRQVLTNAVSERNPLVLAIIATAISAQFMFTFFAKAREEHERFENEQRAKAEKMRDIIKEHLRNGNKTGAKYVLEDLQTYSLADYLSPRERKWLESLLALANKELSSKNDFNQINEILSVWGMEVAGALIAIDQLPEHDTDYQNLLRSLSIKELNDPVLGNKIGELLRKITPLSDYRTDRLPFGLDQRIEGFSKSSFSSLELLPGTQKSNPFLDSKIEREWLVFRSELTNIIFEGAPIKDLLNKIKSNQQNNLIYGRSGCGRTTLAIAYHEFLKTDQDLPYIIYFPDQPEEEKLKFAMAIDLFEYVKRKSVLLLRLNPSKKKLLVAVLLQFLSPLYLEQELEKTIEELDKNQNGQDEVARKRSQIGKTQLEFIQTLIPTHGALFLPPAQVGLSVRLYNRLRDTLSKLEEFHSDEQLRSLFVVDTLSLWQNQLPTASSIIQRVELTINLMYQRFDKDNQRALKLLLKQLRDKRHSDDGLYSELSQLMIALDNVPLPTSLHGNEWVPSLVRIFEWFGFIGVHLIIDAPQESMPNLKQLNPTLAVWREQGIQTTLLVEQAVYDELQLDFPGFYVSELNWPKDQLQQMLNYRVKQIMGTPETAQELFVPPELYSCYLDKSQNNPGQFIALWNRALLKQKNWDNWMTTSPNDLEG